MLAEDDRDRRQLRDLVPPRLRNLDQIRIREHVRAGPATHRPMVDDLVNLLGREQPPVPALVAGLPAPLTVGAWPTGRDELRRRSHHPEGRMKAVTTPVLAANDGDAWVRG